MTCDVCGAASQVNETNADEGTEGHWCLDHTPERYAAFVARARAFGRWSDEWEAWLAKIEDGDPVPSWRVAARSAFRAGIKFANKESAS